jgi:hypothetical protein
MPDVAPGDYVRRQRPVPARSVERPLTAASRSVSAPPGVASSADGRGATRRPRYPRPAARRERRPPPATPRGAAQAPPLAAVVVPIAARRAFGPTWWNAGGFCRRCGNCLAALLARLGRREPPERVHRLIRVPRPRLSTKPDRSSMKPESGGGSPPGPVGTAHSVEQFHGQHGDEGCWRILQISPSSIPRLTIDQEVSL